MYIIRRFLQLNWQDPCESSYLGEIIAIIHKPMNDSLVYYGRVSRMWHVLVYEVEDHPVMNDNQYNSLTDTVLINPVVCSMYGFIIHLCRNISTHKTQHILNSFSQLKKTDTSCISILTWVKLAQCIHCHIADTSYDWPTIGILL